MKTFEDRIKESLPEGSIYLGVTEIREDDVTVFQFNLNNDLCQGSVKRTDLNSYFINPVIVKYEDGMTYEDLYKTINQRYGLGLIKDIDFDNTDGLDIVKNEIISLGVLPSSYGYTGAIPIYLYKTMTNIITDGTNRNLEGVDMSTFFVDKIIQSKLGYKVFTSTSAKLFTGSLISLVFKNKIKNYLKEIDPTYVDDLINGYIEKSFSDGLSDIVSLRTQKGYLYHIRFQSSIADLPK